MSVTWDELESIRNQVIDYLLEQIDRDGIDTSKSIADLIEWVATEVIDYASYELVADEPKPSPPLKPFRSHSDATSIQK